MVKRGTSIQGLGHEEATKSEREAWLHGYGEEDSQPQAISTRVGIHRSTIVISQVISHRLGRERLDVSG